MTTAEVVNATINGCIAVGTLLVAVLAIWGDKVRSCLAGPKLTVVLHNVRGSIVPLTDGPQAIFYHLKVLNLRTSVNATNCHVVLKKIWRRVPNNQFQEVNLAVPLVYVWAPSEITPPYITLRTEHIFDFGLVCEGEDHFRPVLLSYTNNFQGFVRAHDVVRFGLEIVSDNYVSPQLCVFEVAWNGQWNDNLDTMADNLQIRKIAYQT